MYVVLSQRMVHIARLNQLSGIDVNERKAGQTRGGKILAGHEIDSWQIGDSVNLLRSPFPLQ